MGDVAIGEIERFTVLYLGREAGREERTICTAAMA